MSKIDAVKKILEEVSHIRDTAEADGWSAVSITKALNVYAAQIDALYRKFKPPSEDTKYVIGVDPAAPPDELREWVVDALFQGVFYGEEMTLGDLPDGEQQEFRAKADQILQHIIPIIEARERERIYNSVCPRCQAVLDGKIKAGGK